VLKDTQVDNGAKIVGVGKEKNLNAALEQLVEDSGIVE
jgi:hypothetical protein